MKTITRSPSRASKFKATKGTIHYLKAWIMKVQSLSAHSLKLSSKEAGLSTALTRRRTVTTSSWISRWTICSTISIVQPTTGISSKILTYLLKSKITAIAAAVAKVERINSVPGTITHRTLHLSRSNPRSRSSIISRRPQPSPHTSSITPWTTWACTRTAPAVIRASSPIF